MGKPPDIPDLDLPSGNPSRRPSASVPVSQKPARPQHNDADDLFGGGIERGLEGTTSTPTGARPSAAHRGKAISVDFSGGADDDAFGGEIERGGEISLPPPAHSSRAPVSRQPASLNLEVAYRRPGASPPAEAYEPPFIEKAGGRALAAAGIAAAVVPLTKFLHHASAYEIVKLVPHAFDASSTLVSGVLAGVALVVSLAIGYLGIRLRPRSYGLVGAGAAFLFTALAMVTVALVSLEETPSPADGARLIPYLVPGALVLVGLGIAGRGQDPFYDGGARRALPFAFGLAGGLVIFAGITLSAF